MKTIKFDITKDYKNLSNEEKKALDNIVNNLEKEEEQKIKLPNNTAKVTYRKTWQQNGDNIIHTIGGITSIGWIIPLSIETIEELQAEHDDGYIEIIDYETV